VMRIHEGLHIRDGFPVIVPFWTAPGLAGSIPRGSGLDMVSRHDGGLQDPTKRILCVAMLLDGSRSLHSGPCRRLLLGVSDAAPMAGHGSNSRGGMATWVSSTTFRRC
jgi:hypothetical protein